MAATASIQTVQFCHVMLEFFLCWYMLCIQTHLVASCSTWARDAPWGSMLNVEQRPCIFILSCQPHLTICYYCLFSFLGGTGQSLPPHRLRPQIGPISHPLKHQILIGIFCDFLMNLTISLTVAQSISLGCKLGFPHIAVLIIAMLLLLLPLLLLLSATTTITTTFVFV